MGEYEHERLNMDLVRPISLYFYAQLLFFTW